MRPLSELIEILNNVLDVLEENKCTREEITEIGSCLRGDIGLQAQINRTNPRIVRLQRKLDV